MYENVKRDAQEYYKQIKPVFCKALKSDVYFNRLGFQHIIHKKCRHVRDEESQILRFKNLPLAVELVALTTTHQEYECSSIKIQIDHFGEDVSRNKDVTHWGIIAILDKKKVKVILRKVGNGNIHFWSIIPDWKTSKLRDEKYFSYMKGDPNTD